MPSARGGLPKNGAGSISDSRTSLPTDSGNEPYDHQNLNEAPRNQGDFQLDQCNQYINGIDPTKFLRQPLQREDVNQKYQSTNITYRNGSIQ